MAVASDSAVKTLSLEEKFAEGEGDRTRVGVRRELDLKAFGVSAVRAKTGTDLIGEHDELGPASDRHEELYVVTSGRATFTVDGDEIDAPSGTVVVVAPEAKRKAVASEDGTTVIAVGGPVGRAYRLTPGASLTEFFALHGNGDFEGALSVCREALEEYPGNAFITYNVACCEARLGQTEEAFEHLREALQEHADYVATARDDEDLETLRGDARWEKLVPPAPEAA